jgi:hypothetical protein
MSNDKQPEFKWVKVFGGVTVPTDGTHWGGPLSVIEASDGWRITSPAPGVVRIKRLDVDIILSNVPMMLMA